MKVRYYLKRIINNKIKLGVILLIFAFPVIDIFLMLMDIRNGGSALMPNLASFLSSCIFNGSQILLFWYLPLYLLLIVADDCIEDFKLGYKNILVTKWGKIGYFKANIIKGFLISFFVIFLSLVLNLIMTQIAFAGGDYRLFDTNSIEATPSLYLAFQHPLLTNCVYILLASFLSGIVGMGAVAMAMALHNRFLVYPIVFLLWYIPSAIRQSIIIAVQPFTEYSLFDVLPTILIVVAINVASVVFAYIKVIKYEKV